MTFNVLACASGLPVLQAKSMSPAMDVTATRVLAAPQSLRGALLVSFAGSQFAQVPVDATASQLSSALVSLGSGEPRPDFWGLMLCLHSSSAAPSFSSLDVAFLGRVPGGTGASMVLVRRLCVNARCCM